MYNEVKDYIAYDLYPALYDRLDQAGVFDEFKFTRKGTKYESTTVHKISGRDGKTKGQVYVYQNNPGYLIDHSEESKDFIEYIKDRDGLTFYEAIERLANMAAIRPYRSQITPEQLEAIRKADRTAKAWEAAIKYCIQCIRDVQYKEEAKPVIDYLAVSRKYTGQDIETMQLGYLPSKQKLYDYLKAEGFTEEETAAIDLPAFAGATHKITIPIRNARGKAVGMAIRTAEPGQEPKYLYSTGLKKSESLYNLYTKARNGRVVLVEGQLDAAITEARGYTWATVAAIGGKAISRQQIEHLVKAGTREVFICLDNEPATEAEIRKTVALLEELDQLEDRIYIVQLPAGIKDVDELVTTKDIEAFEAAVKAADAYYLYYTGKRIDEYNKQLEKEGRSDKATNDLIDDVQIIAAKIRNPVRREELKTLFTKLLNEAGILTTSEAFADAVERIRYKEDLAKQNEALARRLKESEDLRREGKIDEAIESLANNLREIKLRDKRTEFERLEATQHTEEAVRKRIEQQPEGVRTGYQVQIEGRAEDLLIPAGQLSFIAAPSGHGKTNFLLNVSLNVLQQYPTKEVYLFTFEQSADEVVLYALNTFIDIGLNKGINNNRRTLLDYYKGKDFIASDVRSEFEKKKDLFYKTIAPRLKIINVEYSADELIQYIEYIRKRTDDVLICIDYVQKLRSDRKGRIDGRYTELKFICEDLQAAALPTRTGLPFLIAAQFNRDVLSPLDMQITRIAEASDIEKIASEVLGLWNCTKKIGRKLDNNESSILLKDYDISVKEFSPEPAVILEVLKSRSMSTGHRAKLPYNGNTGRIDQAPAMPGIKRKSTIFE